MLPESRLLTCLTWAPMGLMLVACTSPIDAEPEPTLGKLLVALTSEGKLSNHDAETDQEHEEGLGAREHARLPTSWRSRQHPGARRVIPARILGINDFHGRLSEGLLVANRPVGGAAVLASYLRAAAAEFPDRSLLVHAGDLVGASPPESALLEDEPSIQFLNLLANARCVGARRNADRCNIVGTPGNHEFDEGTSELLRLIHGGNHADGPFLEDPYGGARFPYVSANVLDADSGRPILPPYWITHLGPVRVGVIGAVLKETPTIVTPSGVAGLEFGDEVTAINQRAVELRQRGVEAILVTIHQGGFQTPSDSNPTDPAATVGEPIRSIVAALDDGVDVVLSGHTHAFSNALVENQNGVPILVAQAFSNGTAFDQIDLELDRRTGDVVSKTARIITTFSDEAPGNARDPDVQALVDDARASVAPLVNQLVAQIGGDATRAQSAAGESTLGNLIADAQRAALGTDLALMNPGGIRADLLFAPDASNPADTAGDALWGELFSVQPFGNSLVRMTLTGAQVVSLLEQQWLGQTTPRFLQISGLTYTWDAARADGSKVVEVYAGAALINPTTPYTVAVNSFIAAGGDNFTVLSAGTDRVGGPIDLDAFIAYLSAQPQPVPIPPLARITRLN